MANSATHAALPYPIKGARYTVPAVYLDADGDPTDPTTPDTEISKDNGAFADCAEEVTTATGSNGAGMLTLTGAETDCSLVVLAFKVASGPKATLMTLAPAVLAEVGTGTLSAGSAGGGTLGTLLAYDVTGCFIKTTGGTGGGGTGGASNQARKIVTYNTSSGAFTVTPNWETTPDNTTTYAVLLPEGVTLGMLRALNPTTAGRTLDVSSGGEAGLDWANVGSPTTTVNLSGTTIKTATDVETDTADIQSRLPNALTAGGNMKADALAVSGSTTAADNAEVVFDTDFATNYNATDNYWYSHLANGVVHGGNLAVFTAALWSGDWSGGIAVQGGSVRTALGMLSANLDTQLSDIKTDTAAILLDTGTDGVVVAAGSKTGYSLAASQTFDMTGNITGNLSGTVGGIAGTITTLDALDTAQDTQHATTQAAIADVPTNAELTTALNTLLTTAMTESYNADGAAPTPAQALFVIMQMLTEMSIAGTTMTVKKLDGTTTAFTLTLNDATTPTSVTRAT